MKMAAQIFAITPQIGREGRSLTAAKVERIFSPLKTTLTLLESGGTMLCIISSHFMTHYYPISNRLRRDVARTLGLPIDRVLCFSSHNHCGVKLNDPQYGFGRDLRDVVASDDQLTPEGWELVSRSAAIAEQLSRQMEEVDLRWGVGHERRISHNRKGHRADGTTYMMREEDRLLLGEDFCGDIDDDASVIGFFGKDDGRARGFLTHFTAHPVTAFDPEHPIVFGEYAQVACDALSHAFEGVPVGFLQGCAGDVNSKGLLADKPAQQSVADATFYGQCLGQTYIDIATRLTPSTTDAVGVETREVALPFADVPPVQELDAQIADMEQFLTRCAADDPDTRTCQGLNFPFNMSPQYRAKLVGPLLRWAKWARSFHTGNRLHEAPTHTVVQTTGVRLGDVGIVGLSCEPFDAIGRQIKRGSKLAMTLPCGYMSDTCIAYVPDSGNNGDREYMSAFYRYTETMLPYAQPAGDKLAEEGLAILASMQGAPACAAAK